MDAKELADRLRAFSFVDAQQAADRIERQAADLSALRASTQFCEKHKPSGGCRAMCLVCACEKLSAALSKISYLCGEPNEMECGPYDLHFDENAVVEQVAALRAERDRLVFAVLEAINDNGGPIDADSTVDGIDYVMIRRGDFDALVVLVGAARTGGGAT